MKTNFETDYNFGYKYEQLVEKLFPGRVEYAPIDCKEYDLTILNPKSGNKLLVEVKSDRLAKETGNIGIESHYKGYGSGITTTKSSLWFHFIDGENYYFRLKVNELKRLINSNHFLKVQGGDNKQSTLYLIPMYLLAKYKVDYHN